MPHLRRLLPILGLFLPLALPGQDAQRLLSACNVEWTTPSRGPADSMPLPGASGAGANVWFSGGELRLYLSHNGAYDEDEVLRKLGSLRLRLDGADFTTPKSFSQELLLATGTLVVKATAADGTTLEHRLWFSGETLVIETKSSKPLALEVGYGNWRANPAARGDDQVKLEDGTLTYMHRNATARRSRRLADEQGMDLAKIPLAAAGRVYGCSLVGRDGLAWQRPRESRGPSWQGHEWVALTPVGRQQLLAVTMGAGNKVNPDDWVSRSRAIVDPVFTPSIRKTAELRWETFWSSSYVFIQPKAGAKDPGFQVGRNYQLSRFMDAANQRGEFPLRPNGGIFTVDAPALITAKDLDNPERGKPVPSNPDWRRGGAFVGQSLRWVGWPHIAGGDLDLLEPLLKFYRDGLPLAQARAKALGAEGAVYPEHLSLSGLTEGGALVGGLARQPQLSHHFSSGFEHAWMAIVASQVGGRDLRPDLPWILGQLRFIDTFYRVSVQPPASSGPKSEGEGNALLPKLNLHPANALEVAAGANNPAELVAALHAIIPALLDRGDVGEKEKATLRTLEAKLPALPLTRRGGVQVLALAERWSRLHDAQQTPELHALWPYRLVGRPLPDSQGLALATWEKAELGWGERERKPGRRSDFSGSASLAYAANLSLVDECASRAVAKLGDAGAGARFSAFRGPGNEWIPDLTWSGSGRLGVQEMLLHCEPSNKGRILLLPSWPKGWDVTFRLRAPGNTRITCVVESGKIERLIIDPPDRREQVVVGEGWQLPDLSR